MIMVDIIEKKRDGKTLSKEELSFVINSYVAGNIPDYQMSAFLMAIYFQGMTDLETTNLALLMRDSGDVLNLSEIDGVKVDKHSTGGVGDKTSLVLGPIMAACGAKFAKMSGRGLGHTGGTIDKLEAIPGYNVNIKECDFIDQVNRIGIALVGQSGNLTPADKKIYALRDVTGTVPSIPLIASSIMSKKLASGADAICLDVKVGSGAFMKDKESALKLARLMVQIGKNANKKMTAILTNMDEPLGYAIGNSLEVIEAIDTLNNKGPKDLHDLCITIAGYLLVDANIAKSFEEGKELAQNSILNGSAINKLKELVEAQGGDSSYIVNKEKFQKSKMVLEVKSTKNGYVSRIDALKIGHLAMRLGAGRKTLDDKIDFSVGIVLNKKTGDYVKVGETIAYVHTNREDNIEIMDEIASAFTFSDNKMEYNLIIEVLR
ncbi:MAG: pyrimidine-nucleoside phosphorylase [Anaeroplasmataceae bacterium]